MPAEFVRHSYLGRTGPTRQEDFVLKIDRPMMTVACADVWYDRTDVPGIVLPRRADAPHGCDGWFCRCPCHHARCECHVRLDLIAGVL